METAPLQTLVTHFRGLLWFRSMEDNVCFCLRVTDARAVLKHLHAILKVTKPKTNTFGFGPFEARIDSVARITLPLSLPDYAEQRVPVDREWLQLMKPLLTRALDIIDRRGASSNFTLTFDGDEPVEVELDRRSVPP